MTYNTHSTVGQNAGRSVVPLQRAGSSSTPGTMDGARAKVNCKLQIANCNLQFGSHHSPAPSPPPRGISLTEVLIAMGILTVGLLGVASVFPVASFYMQKGDVANNGSAIAQAAFNDALVRGYLDPANWLMFENRSPGFYLGTYSKRFKEELNKQLTATVTATGTALQKQQRTNNNFGFAYVIDPLAADASPLVPANPQDRTQPNFSQTLPYDAPGLINYAYSHWWPWNPATYSPNLPRWPLVRVTLPQAGTRPDWSMTTAVADRLFRSNDDLAIEMPAISSKPSIARLTSTNAGATPLARQSRGDYSWIATVVPTSVEARNALATDPSAYPYEVSIAVFHKRVLDNLAADAIFAERLTTAKVVSTGLSGGELLIERAGTAPDPYASLKVGNWVLVCGPAPTSTSARPQFIARWYRVLSIAKEASGIITNPATQRLVGLRGPQWPWQPGTNFDSSSSLSNNLCLCIVPNVVAVHSKTIRLGEKSSWSVQ